MDPVKRYQEMIDELMKLRPGKRQVAPGIYDEEKVTKLRTIVVDELVPGHDYGPDMFVGDIDSPEAHAYFRRISGGPEDVSHIQKADDDGWLFDEVWTPPSRNPAGELVKCEGIITPDPSIEFRWMLTDMEVFRGPDWNHYGRVFGLARTRERADELHWLTLQAPVEIDDSSIFYRFRPKGSHRSFLCWRIAGPRW